MNHKDHKTTFNKGTCKYCSVVVIDQHLDICPYCNSSNPFIPLEDGVIALLKQGYRLYAIRLLTNANQWDIKTAREYCEKLYVKTSASYARPIDDLIEELARSGQIMQAIKMVRDQCPVESSWGLKQAKEYVEIMYLTTKRKLA